jgi:diguanylate cyclase (GGDEF)-like protein/PAS domain S-box-containing protein
MEPKTLNRLERVFMVSMIPTGDQYRMIVESAPNMIWRAGTDSLCNYFNATWLAFTGRTQEQENGNGWAEGVHPDDLDRCINIYMKNFEARKAFEMEYRLRRHDGEWRWINDMGVPYRDDVGEFAGFIGSCMDVTDKVEGNLLREMAQVDGLTGALNRQYFENIARIAFQKSTRYGTELCVAMLDIDRFKGINDTFGHQAGDAVLRRLAHALKTNVREFDLVGRFGGDEFMLLLPDTTQQEATILLDRLEERIRSLEFIFLKPGTEERHSIQASITYGLAERRTETTLDQLMALADSRLYERKNAT